jgi:hypothetical protein
MINSVLLIIGSATIVIWGTAHLFPTKSVVKGFGEISMDNQNILKMEWITEGISLIFTGILLLSITIFGNPESLTAEIVFIAASVYLFCMAILSLFTGFRVNFLPYKLCPLIFTISGVLILTGTLL